MTAMRKRAARNSGSGGKGDFLAIQIHDLDKKESWADDDLIPSKNLPPPFDFERLTRFMAYGFLMAPIQHRWYAFLSATFPVSKSAAFVPALKRVAFDQFIFAPISLTGFFTFMTIAEGGGKRAVSRKLQEAFVPALKANFMVWPAVQIINFRLVPVQFQIVSSFSCPCVCDRTDANPWFLSLSYRPSVLLGPHTSLFRTLPMTHELIHTDSILGELFIFFGLGFHKNYWDHK